MELAMAQDVSTIGGLVDLALQRTQIIEASCWIAGLKRGNGGQAFLLGSCISPDNVAAVCYGISLEVVKRLQDGDDSLFEAKGHSFLEEIRSLATELGASITAKKSDKIDALKNVFQPI
jgi:hypothetical protein